MGTPASRFALLRSNSSRERGWSCSKRSSSRAISSPRRARSTVLSICEASSGWIGKAYAVGQTGQRRQMLDGRLSTLCARWEDPVPETTYGVVVVGGGDNGLVAG